MNSDSFTDSVVERAALAWLEGVGWQVRNGAEIAPAELQVTEAEHAIKETTL